MTAISILKVTYQSGTYFKQSPDNQANLQETDKYAANQGEIYAVLECKQSKDVDHWLVNFGSKLRPKQGDPKQNWYVFKAHVEIYPTGLNTD